MNSSSGSTESSPSNALKRLSEADPKLLCRAFSTLLTQLDRARDEHIPSEVTDALANRTVYVDGTAVSLPHFIVVEDLALGEQVARSDADGSDLDLFGVDVVEDGCGEDANEGASGWRLG